MKWLSDLSDRAQSLLEKEREFGPERADRRERVLARARGTPRQAAGARGGVLWLRPGRLLAASLILLIGAASYAAWRRTRSAVQSPTVVVTPPSAALSGEPQAPVTSSSAVVPAPIERVDEMRPARPPKIDPAPAASPSSAGTYALELAVLEPARAAVARGDHASALRAIGNHERRFPAGILREEREALRVKALSGLGKDDEARKAAERFRERFPRSVLAPSLEEAVKKPR